MSDVVVDSCIMAKWVLPEADSAQAMCLLTEVVDRGNRLFTLDIAIIEAMNAIWGRCHRRLITSDCARGFVTDLLVSPVERLPSESRLKAAFEIALTYDRAIYDALFVALAADLQLPGVTADEPLWQAVHEDFPNIVLLRNWR
jgi:predicted nucleic acid-binding protein